MFTCYKFRTMAQGAPLAGSHEVSGSWITPIGRRLRSLKLDELPQLFNVLRGDMSLVGPRPCLPNQAEVIAARRARDVFNIRPGITGIAQLTSIDMSKPEQARGKPTAVTWRAALFWRLTVDRGNRARRRLRRRGKGVSRAAGSQATSTAIECRALAFARLGCGW